MLLFVFFKMHCIGGVMVTVLASSAVDRGFETQTSQTKDYKIGIGCFFLKKKVGRRVYPQTVVSVS